jgi:hypothetical protein
MKGFSPLSGCLGKGKKVLCLAPFISFRFKPYAFVPRLHLLKVILLLHETA